MQKFFSIFSLVAIIFGIWGPAPVLSPELTFAKSTLIPTGENSYTISTDIVLLGPGATNGHAQFWGNWLNEVWNGAAEGYECPKLNFQFNLRYEEGYDDLQLLDTYSDDFDVYLDQLGTIMSANEAFPDASTLYIVDNNETDYYRGWVRESGEEYSTGTVGAMDAGASIVTVIHESAHLLGADDHYLTASDIEKGAEGWEGSSAESEEWFNNILGNMRDIDPADLRANPGNYIHDNVFDEIVDTIEEQTGEDIDCESDTFSYPFVTRIFSYSDQNATHETHGVLSGIINVAEDGSISGTGRIAYSYIEPCYWEAPISDGVNCKVTSVDDASFGIVGYVYEWTDQGDELDEIILDSLESMGNEDAKRAPRLIDIEFIPYGAPLEYVELWGLSGGNIQSASLGGLISGIDAASFFETPFVVAPVSMDDYSNKTASAIDGNSIYTFSGSNQVASGYGVFTFRNDLQNIPQYTDPSVYDHGVLNPSEAEAQGIEEAQEAIDSGDGQFDEKGNFDERSLLQEVWEDNGGGANGFDAFYDDASGNSSGNSAN